MQEKELKIKLEREVDYLTVRDNLTGFKKEIEQTNIYFDTPDQVLLQHGVMVRLRHADELHIITVKCRASAEHGYFTAFEWEKEINTQSAESIDRDGKFPAEIFSALPAHFGNVIEVERLIEVGRTRNLRRMYQAGGFTIELDQFHPAPGQQDYEVEVETDNPAGARQFLQQIFLQHKVQYKDQTMTKYRRFLQQRMKEKT